MRRRVVTSSALVAAVVLGACATAGQAGGLDPRFVAVHNAMAAMGMAQVGPIQQGSLAEGREARVRVDLGAECATIVALGSGGVRDVDLALLDADGDPVARDTTHDLQAAVRTCPTAPGSYTLVVTMSKGAGDWIAATWAGSAGVAPATAPTAPTTSEAAGAGTCESPILLAGGAVAGNTRRGESEQVGSCASSDAREIVYRLDVPRRQRVRLEVDASFDSVLHLRQDDCADADAEVACNDDATSATQGSDESSSVIDEVLDPGRYFVFVDGYGSEVGTYHLKAELADVPSLADACGRARILAGAKLTSQLDGAFDNGHGSCADGAKGPDAIHRFDVARRSRVRVTAESTDFSPVVHVRRQCTDAGSEIGCASGGASGAQATFVGVLDPGSFTVFADSTEKSAHGRFTLQAETAPENGIGTRGDGCGDALPLASQERRVEGDTFQGRDDVAGKCTGQGAPDVLYRFEVLRRSRVSAYFLAQEGSHVFVLTRTCGDRSTELACSANLDETLEPGVYSLAVDGAAQEGLGRYAFSFAAKDVTAQESACKAPPLIASGQTVRGTTAGAGDRFTTSCGGREDAQASADRVYRIKVAQRSRVELVLTTPSFDGVLAVRKPCTDPPHARAPRASEVACSNDRRDAHISKIATTLDPGTYYVVVDGNERQTGGPFTLSYKVLR